MFLTGKLRGGFVGREYRPGTEPGKDAGQSKSTTPPLYSRTRKRKIDEDAFDDQRWHEF